MIARARCRRRATNFFGVPGADENAFPLAQLPTGLRLHDSPAWVVWPGLHLLTLVGFRNRVSVFVNWAWSYLTWDRGPRLIFSPLSEERMPLPPGAEDDE